VKAIILSGYASDPVMSDYGAHGFKAALIKPVRIPLLHETIEQVLGLITK
jgi:CheY-like chemotaxis protein